MARRYSDFKDLILQNKKKYFILIKNTSLYKKIMQSEVFLPFRFTKFLGYFPFTKNFSLLLLALSTFIGFKKAKAIHAMGADITFARILFLWNMGLL